MFEGSPKGRSVEVESGLRAFVLLAGQVGRSPFLDAVGRSGLDLPVGGGRTILDLWMDQFDGLARDLGLTKLRVLVAIDSKGQPPRTERLAGVSRIAIEVVRDPAAYRGTAGVVKDLTRDFDAASWVLVAGANQIVREPLHELFAQMSAVGESVSVAPGAGGEMAGMFLLRCDRLRDVPDIGFVDLKEQAIPAARGHAPLLVSRRPRNSAMPVRTLAEYLQALRELHAPVEPAGRLAAPEDAYAERWMPAFSIVEPGAHVAPGAVLQDSVVLAGARVEAGATVARSLVCDGGVVRRSECVVETLVTQER